MHKKENPSVRETSLGVVLHYTFKMFEKNLYSEATIT